MRPQGEVRLTRLRLGRRFQADPDVSGHGVEVEHAAEVVGYADCQGAGGRAQIHRAARRGDGNIT